MGSEIKEAEKGVIGSPSFYTTHQFSLEIVIHERLKLSPMRTMDPSQADMFYVPAYIGSLCAGQHYQGIAEKVNELKNFLDNSDYFLRGKPHFSAAAKIQREMASNLCPYLQQPFTNNITYLGIERQHITSSIYHIYPYSLMLRSSIIVVPYPSYGHFRLSEETHLNTPHIRDREVKILLPVGTTRSNPKRAKLMDQFPLKTKQPFYKLDFSRYTNTHMVLFYASECDIERRKSLISWMEISVFCVQPPGDSPSRKSFYDSIMSGCIPVILKEEHEPNPYAFHHILDYDSFSITLDFDLIHKYNHNIETLLSDISMAEIENKQRHLKQIAKYLQYSIPNGKSERESDAFQLVFQQLAEKYRLPYDRKLHVGK